ncbi:hypothetical protein YA0871_07440 [Pseudomonas paralactis]|jgi:hypothetical protein|uniref:Uncharacterized protein n=1 Tax=Pseudomonas paralactis TaxID=1615673 RepID=A0ABS0UWS8_9PSED|nr:hypothetical protein [Pseudomonas paralactis]MBI6632488.1 hypothetical protein [Pseudomonas paralactis]
MFRLNEAVRLYQAQKSSPGSASVATSVTTLSPRAGLGTTAAVATVASVTTPPIEPTDLPRLIEQLREEGALVHLHEKALMFRPVHWHQVARFSPHWKAVLLFLQAKEIGDDNGSGRSA